MPPPEGAPRRPDSVTLSFWTGIASVVVGFALLAVSFAVGGDDDVRMVADSLRAQGQQLTEQDVRALYSVVVVATFGVMAVVAALWIMFLFFMRSGRNWARIVITAVGVAWFALTVPAVQGGPVVVLLALVQLAAIGATVVAAFLAPSNEYFAAGRR
ncbi:hypothetical protein GCM10010470_62260 [Saccharopolyspora taberi]|uniref:Integral membrane protein n=2 Tax=Saccharopolyspora taberi TaxID=60895 RepID=A0ABN3VLZ6_9PSEU